MTAAARPKLAVWKFSSCDGCQLSLLDCEDELLAIAEGVEIAYFPEATSGEIEGPYDVSLVEGSVTTAHDVERIHEVRRAVRRPDHDRRLRDRGRHPGAPELRRRARVDPARLRLARVHLHARDVDADRRPRAGRPRAARVPDLEGTAGGDGQRAAQRAAAAAALDERVHGVQGTGHAVRDGRARDAVPRPGHAGRLRRDLPCLRPRLLRLLRPDGVPQHQALARSGRSSARATRSCCAHCAPSTRTHLPSGRRAYDHE